MARLTSSEKILWLCYHVRILAWNDPLGSGSLIYIDDVHWEDYNRGYRAHVNQRGVAPKNRDHLLSIDIHFYV